MNPLNESHRPLTAASRIWTEAGPRLQLALAEGGVVPLGETKVTEAYDVSLPRLAFDMGYSRQLPASLVAHTHESTWWGTNPSNREDILRRCYRSALEASERNGADSVALRVLSTGPEGAWRSALQECETAGLVISLMSPGVFTDERSTTIALEEIKSFLRGDDHRGTKSLTNVSLYVPKGKGEVLHHAIEQTAGFDSITTTQWGPSTQPSGFGLSSQWPSGYRPLGLPGPPWQRFPSIVPVAPGASWIPFGARQFDTHPPSTGTSYDPQWSQQCPAPHAPLCGDSFTSFNRYPT